MSLRPPIRPKFPRFSEASRSNVNRDFQVHTNWTDGEGSVAEVIARAREVGLEELAFTEHARADSDYYPEFFAEIDSQAADADGLTLFRGFEVKVLDEEGALDISGPMRAAADIVLASVHSFPLADGGVAPAREFPEDKAADIEFALAKGAVQARSADVLSHAGGMCLRNFGGFPDRYMEELVRLAAKHGMAFEINLSYHAPVLDRLLALLSRYDPPFSVGSDAHRLDQIGTCRDRLLEALPL